MGHELDFNNNRYSFAYANQKAWHGLGQKMNDNEPLEEWIKKAGFDYNVIRKPIMYYDNIGNLITYKNKNVLLRDDTHKPLSIVSEHYKIVQPKEVIYFFESLIREVNLTMETAGVLMHGKKIFALAKLPNELKLTNNDIVNGYLLLATSFDGTLATTAQITSIRVVCNNTLTWSLDSNQKHIVKTNHSEVFKPESVKIELGLIEEKWNNFSQFLTKLTEVKVNNIERQRIFHEIANVKNVKNEEERKEKLETVDLLNHIYYNYDGQNEISCKDTAFGVINAVSAYTDHFRGNKLSKTPSSPSRTNKVLFGTGYLMKKRTLELVSEMI